MKVNVMAETARIIPAYAGSTGGSVWEAASMTDHPRIRGEHVAYLAQAFQEMGSSPHTRGARLGVAAAHDGVRIIPAYAGSTSGPRAALLDAPGSSPHTRGAPPDPGG